MSHITPLHLNKTQPRAFVGNWNLPLQLKRYFEYFNNLIRLWNLFPWDIVAWNFFLLTFNLFTTSINNGFENQISHVTDLHIDYFSVVEVVSLDIVANDNDTIGLLKSVLLCVVREVTSPNVTNDTTVDEISVYPNLF